MAILEIELVNGEAIHNGVLYENAIVKVESAYNDLDDFMRNVANDSEAYFIEDEDMLIESTNPKLTTLETNFTNEIGKAETNKQDYWLIKGTTQIEEL